MRKHLSTFKHMGWPGACDALAFVLVLALILIIGGGGVMVYMPEPKRTDAILDIEGTALAQAETRYAIELCRDRLAAQLLLDAACRVLDRKGGDFATLARLLSVALKNEHIIVRYQMSDDEVADNAACCTDARNALREMAELAEGMADEYDCDADRYADMLAGEAVS